MRHKIIDREHLPERNRQVHELLQVNGFGALKFREQPDHPDKKKKIVTPAQIPMMTCGETLPRPNAAPSSAPAKHNVASINAATPTRTAITAPSPPPRRD